MLEYFPLQCVECYKLYGKVTAYSMATTNNDNNKPYYTIETSAFKMLGIFVCSVLLAEVGAAGTRGNAGKIGGSFLVGSPPSIIRRVGFSLDDDIERDAHGVYGFMCQSSALKGEVFQVGKCFDESQKKWWLWHILQQGRDPEMEVFRERYG